MRALSAIPFPLKRHRKLRVGLPEAVALKLAIVPAKFVAL